MQAALKDPDREKYRPGQMDFPSAPGDSSSDEDADSDGDVYEEEFDVGRDLAHTYRVPGTGAVCTIYGAKSLLFKFCAQLPADRWE